MIPTAAPSPGKFPRVLALVVAFALGLSAMVGLSLSVPSAAHASTPGWWSGDCDVNNYPGSYPLGGTYAGVEACGGGSAPAPGRLVRFSAGAYGEYEWQCVELVMRYMYQVWGVAPYGADGWQVVSNYSGSVFTKVTNNGASAPSAGDVMSYGQSDPGHTSIVTSTSLNAAGTGSITILQENIKPQTDGTATVSVNHNVVAGTVTGWLHAPNSPSSTSGETVFQANTGHLFGLVNSAYTDLNQGMMTGTSPSVATSGSGWVAAFQANTGTAHTYLSNGTGVDTGQAMSAGTSPAVATLDNGGYAVAFQSSGHQLFVYSSTTGVINTFQGMDPASSPAIVPMPGGGWVVAFEANTDGLYTYTAGGTSTNTNQGMAGGTSPSITTEPNNGYEVAFQSNVGHLTTWGSSGNVDTQLGMASGTSPSIGQAPGGGYVAAINANTNHLYLWQSSGGATDLLQGMKAGTNPSIKAPGDGSYRIAFQSNINQLNVYSSGSGDTNAAQGMAANTSPATS